MEAVSVFSVQRGEFGKIIEGKIIFRLNRHKKPSTKM
jgi:hypothetical protein